MQAVTHSNSLPESYDPVNPEAKCFKIKEIATKIFISLAAVLGAAVFASALVTLIIPASPIGLIALTVTSAALGILLGLKLWQLITPHLPNGLRIVANHIQNLALGLLSLISQAIILPIDLTKSDPKTSGECSPNTPPTIFIHGFLGSSNNWVYHRYRLKAAGFKNIFSINLGSPFNSIDDFAKELAKKVEEVKKLTGRNDVRLVCHSMGGLVAMQYLYHYSKEQGINVTDIITIGTPLNGTYAAHLTLGVSKCGKEMKPKSDFLTNLRKLAQDDTETNYYHIASKVDYVIRPLSSASDAPSPNAKVDVLDATGHVPFLFSDKTADLLISYLKPAPQ